MKRARMQNRMRLLTPIGELPEPNEDLRLILEENRDADQTVVIKKIDEWNKLTTKRFKEVERTEKTYNLTP